MDKPENPLMGIDQVLLEDQILIKASQSSRSINKLIVTGERYDEPVIKERIYRELLQFIIDLIGVEYSREACNYAELIGFSNLVGNFLSSQYF